MSSFKPEKIFIHPAVFDLPRVQKILSKLPDIPMRVNPQPEIEYSTKADRVEVSKKVWFLTASPGELVKDCPATPVQLCCRYRVINVISNCPIDCSYCILQGYINNPYTTIQVNLEDIKSQIQSFLATDPHHIFRFGTGELSDSLVLEEYTEFSQELAQFFLGFGNGFFEIKTKSHKVDNLLTIEPKEKIAISWSVNPEEIIQLEEKGASPLLLRLAAAKRCEKQGYLLGFHFDPIILFPDWEAKYREVVHQIFTTIDPKRVIWVSLGGFRYPRFLKPIIKERFPKSKILLGELFPGRDGKFRYLKIIRVRMYQKMVSWIKEYNPEQFIYLCMESPEVWEKVFGFTPNNRRELDLLFIQRIRRYWCKK
ncbi:MAG: hypothetical protein N3A64_02770 [Desulfobacterota bacterium]|nr:hypothetical protein [Thermodesulfobacteriota bacterium]